MKVNGTMLSHSQLRSKNLEEDGTMLSHSQLRSKNLEGCWLNIKSIANVIPTAWITIIKQNLQSPPELAVKYDEIINNKKCSVCVYNYLCRKEEANLYKYANKWNEINDISIGYDDYLQLFNRIYKLTDWAKLRDFQYRLLLGKVFTNDTLYKWKIVPTATCGLCRQEKQIVVHLLIQCSQTCPIWLFMQNTCKSSEYSWAKSDIMGNTVHSKVKHVMNLVVLVTKHYIFQQKCLSNIITVSKWQQHVRQMYNITRFNDKSNSVTEKWGPVLHLFLK